jgi:hypothetical protein
MILIHLTDDASGGVCAAKMLRTEYARGDKVWLVLPIDFSVPRKYRVIGPCEITSVSATIQNGELCIRDTRYNATRYDHRVTREKIFDTRAEARRERDRKNREATE